MSDNVSYGQTVRKVRNINLFIMICYHVYDIRKLVDHPMTQKICLNSMSMATLIEYALVGNLCWNAQEI